MLAPKIPKSPLRCPFQRPPHNHERSSQQRTPRQTQCTPPRLSLSRPSSLAFPAPLNTPSNLPNLTGPLNTYPQRRRSPHNPRHQQRPRGQNHLSLPPQIHCARRARNPREVQRPERPHRCCPQQARDHEVEARQGSGEHPGQDG